MPFLWDFFFDREIWRAERQQRRGRRGYLKYEAKVLRDPDDKEWIRRRDLYQKLEVGTANMIELVMGRRMIDFARDGWYPYPTPRTLDFGMTMTIRTTALGC